MFMNLENNIILAIDYGTVRIGLARSFYLIAEPLEIIPNDEKAVEKITKIAKENGVTHIVFGISENEMAKKTQAFVEDFMPQINKIMPNITYEFFDETLSSNSVHKKLTTAKKSKRTANIDHLAASEFLQEWLDIRS